jgi:hypothetical protein
MIVRIATAGQYEVSEQQAEVVRELEEKALKECEAGDEELFRSTFERLLALIHSHGRLLSDEELLPSELILPPPDVSFEEARAGFSGEGLIPE